MTQNSTTKLELSGIRRFHSRQCQLHDGFFDSRSGLDEFEHEAILGVIYFPERLRARIIRITQDVRGGGEPKPAFSISFTSKFSSMRWSVLASLEPVPGFALLSTRP